jgi:uncharacterized linocin/CFP29 family protein
MLEIKEINFLSWLMQRLINKYSLSKNHYIINSLNKIINKNTKKYFVDIDKQDLDLILSKYYADFFLDNCEHLNIGYSEKDRENLRVQILSMVSDIVNNNIPREPLIKG